MIPEAPRQTGTEAQGSVERLGFTPTSRGTTATPTTELRLPWPSLYSAHKAPFPVRTSSVRSPTTSRTAEFPWLSASKGQGIAKNLETKSLPAPRLSSQEKTQPRTVKNASGTASNLNFARAVRQVSSEEKPPPGIFSSCIRTKRSSHHRNPTDRAAPDNPDRRHGT